MFFSTYSHFSSISLSLDNVIILIPSTCLYLLLLFYLFVVFLNCLFIFFSWSPTSSPPFIKLNIYSYPFISYLTLDLFSLCFLFFIHPLMLLTFLSSLSHTLIILHFFFFFLILMMSFSSSEWLKCVLSVHIIFLFLCHCHDGTSVYLLIVLKMRLRLWVYAKTSFSSCHSGNTESSYCLTDMTTRVVSVPL